MKKRFSLSSQNQSSDPEGQNYSKPYNAMTSTSSNLQSRQLLHLFQSEDFTPDQVIRYFILTFDEPGPHQFLTHKLLSMSDKFVEYYIPQFCYMLVKNGSYSMESFLEEICKRSISNYLKVVWCLIAYLEGKDAPRIDKIERRLEAAMINCANKFTRLDVMANQDSVDFNIRLQKMIMEKEQRFNYVSIVARFVHNMIKLSLTLKQKEPEERKAFLQDQITKGNKVLRRHRESHSDLPFFWGIMFPFERTYDNSDASNLIVRIIETDFACFNTKTRVPYRILVETVSEKEITQKQQNHSYQYITQEFQTQTSDSDEFLKVQENYASLESQMRELTKDKIEDQAFQRLKNFHNEQMNRTIRSLSKISNNEPKRKLKISKSLESLLRSHAANSDEEKTKPSRHMSAEIRSRKITIKKQQLLQVINQEYEKNEIISEEEQNHEKIHPKFCGPWGEDWDDKFKRLRDKSPFKDFESLRIRAIIVKGGDDLRQELLAMQVIQKVHTIFDQASPVLNLYLKPYEIIITSENSGVLEYCPNTLSMDGLKKMLQGQKTLKQFYQEHFQEDFYKAQRNFVESLAAYSLITYILQAKDRHNGNILIDNQGHIIHIDFGFMLSNSPGNMNFESAPFKLTAEYLDLLNGQNSQLFEYFRQLMFKGFLAIRKHTQAIVQLVEIMAEKSNFPCFKNFKLDKFVERFQENKTEQEV